MGIENPNLSLYEVEYGEAFIQLPFISHFSFSVFLEIISVSCVGFVGYKLFWVCLVITYCIFSLNFFFLIDTHK